MDFQIPIQNSIKRELPATASKNKYHMLGQQGDYDIVIVIVYTKLFV